MNIEDALWSSFLLTLQTVFNNSEIAIEHFSNEIVYDFKTRKISGFIQSRENFDMNYVTERSIYRLKVTDVISFVIDKVKAWYNKKHKSMILKEESFAFLRLHHEYHLLDHLSWKLTQQYYESFWIQWRVSKLAYKIKLSVHWRIHSVIFIAQLESALKEVNSYNWSWSSHLNSILVEDDIKKWVFYEINRLVNKRLQRYEKESVIKEYLIR